MAMADGPHYPSALAISHQPSAIRKRRRRVRNGPDDAGELTALEQLAASSTSAGDLVFGSTDGLLGAAGGFDGQQIAVAARGDEAEHAIVLAELDEQHA